MKLIGLGVIPAFVLLELFRVAGRAGVPGAVWRALLDRGLALLVMLAATAVDAAAGGVAPRPRCCPPTTRALHVTYAGSPFTHIHHMLSYAAELKAVTPRHRDQLAAVGVAVRPAGDQLQPHRGQLAHRREDHRQPRGVRRPRADQPVHHLHGAPRACSAPSPPPGTSATGSRPLGAAWCLGVFLPFVIQYSAFDRISYLYYMLLVMPGVYIVAARLFAPGRVPRAATLGWAVALRLRAGEPVSGPLADRPLSAVARVFVSRRLPGPGARSPARRRPRGRRVARAPAARRRASSATGWRTPTACSRCSPTGSTPSCSTPRRGCARSPTTPSATTTSTWRRPPRAGSRSATRPDVLTDATADLTFALLLAAARRIPAGRRPGGHRRLADLGDRAPPRGERRRRRR